MKFHLVQKGCNRTDVLTVGDDFATESKARVGTQLTLEVRAVHLLALGAVVDANAQDVVTTKHVCNNFREVIDGTHLL